MPTHHLDDFDNAAKGYGQDGQDDDHGDDHGHFRDKFTWTTLITQQRDMGKMVRMMAMVMIMGIFVISLPGRL